MTFKVNLTAAFQRAAQEDAKKVDLPADGTLDAERRALEWNDTTQEWEWAETLCDLPQQSNISRMEFGQIAPQIWEFTAAELALLEAQFVGQSIRLDRYKMENFPDDLWFNGRRLSYAYNCDFTNTTSFPSMTGTQSLLDQIYIDQGGVFAGQSPGQAGINDIPTTWRNATGLQRIYLRRNSLTAAQQTGIMNGIEREALAGMGSLYTTTRQVYLNSGGAGANDPFDQFAAVIAGWSIISATAVQKNIGGGVWRINHL